MGLLDAARALRDACDDARLDGVPYVYNPLRYAWDAHASYCRAFGEGRRPRALLVGMNPGPHGMGQTGVPFGDVVWVRDWMRVRGKVQQPAKLHPKRPVLGFECRRREPSGNRLYSWGNDRYGSAAAFFSAFYVVNYCPLLFFDEGGRNLTPPQIPRRVRETVDAACDEHLRAVVDATRPAFVIGVGAFATEKIRNAIKSSKNDITIGTVLHPSPASPAANRGWARQAEAQLTALGIPSPRASGEPPTSTL